MNGTRNRPAIWAGVYLTVMCLLGMYFTFASVQGEFGLFQRVQIEVELDDLKEERARLEAEVATLENKTHRLSDAYLDLELLDQQAREVLGLVRADEVVLR